MANANVTSTEVIFCLKVNQISKLDEIFSPEVIIHNIPWKVCVQKLNCDGHFWLLPSLQCAKNEKKTNWSHTAQATFTLLPLTDKHDDDDVNEHSGEELSSNGHNTSSESSTIDVETATEPIEELIVKFSSINIDPTVSWDELFKPQNRFVKDDSIVIKVKITANNPKGIVFDKQKETIFVQMECAICMDNFFNQSISSTTCGHLFCTPCISKSIESYGICPLCNTPLLQSSLQRVYLPIVNNVD